MLLVDTSVWIDHLRSDDARLAKLLGEELVATHPFVIGELACGNLQNRRELLHLLEQLPQIEPIAHHEALALLDAHQLMGRGLGWVDIHLLGAAMVAGVRLWTRDRRLHQAGAELLVN